MELIGTVIADYQSKKAGLLGSAVSINGSLFGGGAAFQLKKTRKALGTDRGQND